MPVIVMCSTKGGVGKSTTALVLAQVYSAAGREVTLIDADPNQPLAKWAKRFAPTVPQNLHVVGNINEENIIDAIDDATKKHPFVIIDLEGSANEAASYAISRADLVLIPTRGKQLDADEVGKVIALIERGSKLFRRKVDYRVVFTMMGTTAVKSKEYRHIRAGFEEKGIPILPAAMTERAAFTAMFQIGGTIFDLTAEDVSKPQSAINDARQIAEAVVTVLREKKEAA